MGGKPGGVETGKGEGRKRGKGEGVCEFIYLAINVVISVCT